MEDWDPEKEKQVKAERRKQLDRDYSIKKKSLNINIYT